MTPAKILEQIKLAEEVFYKQGFHDYRQSGEAVKELLERYEMGREQGFSDAREMAAITVGSWVTWTPDHVVLLIQKIRAMEPTEEEK